AVVDVGGVGYKLSISENTYSGIRVGEKVRLFTHLAVREDDIELFGFLTEAELNTFKLLITVSGIGPRVTLNILSLMTPEELATAVVTENVKAISKAQNVGTKTANRIVLELKDKLSAGQTGSSSGFSSSIVTGSSPAGGKGKLNEAVEALMVLGYNRSEALTLLKDIDLDKLTLEEIIKEAFRKLNQKKG
ncbi:MAG: Holliday junction branch migration protein RuvA, partial [Clostridia bacterium]|nr:Holliday junction branch migration protein RuvA [Clostridia bacterium]